MVTKKNVAIYVIFLWPFLAFCFSFFSCFRRCFRRWDLERVPGCKTSISRTFHVAEIPGRLAFGSTGSCHNSISMKLRLRNWRRKGTQLVLLQIFLWICLPLCRGRIIQDETNPFRMTTALSAWPCALHQPGDFVCYRLSDPGGTMWHIDGQDLYGKKYLSFYDPRLCLALTLCFGLGWDAAASRLRSEKRCKP